MHNLQFRLVSQLDYQPEFIFVIRGFDCYDSQNCSQLNNYS